MEIHKKSNNIARRSKLRSARNPLCAARVGDSSQRFAPPHAASRAGAPVAPPLPRKAAALRGVAWAGLRSSEQTPLLSEPHLRCARRGFYASLHPARHAARGPRLLLLFHAKLCFAWSCSGKASRELFGLGYAGFPGWGTRPRNPDWGTGAYGGPFWPSDA